MLSVASCLFRACRECVSEVRGGVGGGWFLVCVCFFACACVGTGVCVLAWVRVCVYESGVILVLRSCKTSGLFVIAIQRHVVNLLLWGLMKT